MKNIFLDEDYNDKIVFAGLSRRGLRELLPDRIGDQLDKNDADRAFNYLKKKIDAIDTQQKKEEALKDIEGMRDIVSRSDKKGFSIIDRKLLLGPSLGNLLGTVKAAEKKKFFMGLLDAYEKKVKSLKVKKNPYSF